MKELNNWLKFCCPFFVDTLKYLVKRLLRSKDINEKLKLYFLKMYFKRILVYVAETGTATKREDSKIQVMKVKFFRAI